VLVPASNCGSYPSSEVHVSTVDMFVPVSNCDSDQSTEVPGSSMEALVLDSNCCSDPSSEVPVLTITALVPAPNCGSYLSTEVPISSMEVPVPATDYGSESRSDEEGDVIPVLARKPEIPVHLQLLKMMSVEERLQLIKHRTCLHIIRLEDGKYDMLPIDTVFPLQVSLTEDMILSQLSDAVVKSVSLWDPAAEKRNPARHHIMPLKTAMSLRAQMGDSRFAEPELIGGKVVYSEERINDFSVQAYHFPYIEGWFTYSMLNNVASLWNFKEDLQHVHSYFHSRESLCFTQEYFVQIHIVTAFDPCCSMCFDATEMFKASVFDIAPSRKRKGISFADDVAEDSFQRSHAASFQVAKALTMSGGSLQVCETSNVDLN
jgi:hypothetical protein